MRRLDGQENTPMTIAYRVKVNGTAITQSDVSSMRLYVYEAETNTEKTAEGGEALTVSAVVFNTLQSWDFDDEGYNVRVTVAGSYLSDGGKTYRAEVKITPASGEAYYLEHVEIHCLETYSA